MRHTESLARYVEQVLEWNQTLGLVSRKEPVAACERLILESLELDQLLALSGPARIADVGSGAGFPGVVWAVEHEDAQFVLIERRARRAAFLERAVRALALRNIFVIAHDVRDSIELQKLRGSFDMVVTMAVGSPLEVGPQIEPLLGAGGRYATTIPSAVDAPGRVGRALALEARTAGKFGCYAVYRVGI